MPALCRSISQGLPTDLWGVFAFEIDDHDSMVIGVCDIQPLSIRTDAQASGLIKLDRTTFRAVSWLAGAKERGASLRGGVDQFYLETKAQPIRKLQ